MMAIAIAIFFANSIVFLLIQRKHGVRLDIHREHIARLSRLLQETNNRIDRTEDTKP
jgi:hypothetical protein